MVSRRGGGFYGYKIHAAVCTTTGLPVAWTVLSAKRAETTEVPGLLDSARERGFPPGVAVLDKGYDQQSVYEVCESRNIRPVIPLRQTPSVVAGKHLPPSCQHGDWTFAGSDAKRGASKWRCPTGECAPASKWIAADRLHTLVPRSSDRWKSIYKTRGAVEREFGRLKHQWTMLPLRVRDSPASASTSPVRRRAARGRPNRSRHMDPGHPGQPRPTGGDVTMPGPRKRQVRASARPPDGAHMA